MSLNRPEPSMAHAARPRPSSASATGGRTSCACSPRTPRVDVRWICDRDAERLARFHRRYPPRARRAEVQRGARGPEVDAVVIATPVFTHFELAVREPLGRQAHVRREAAGALHPAGGPADRARGRRRARADVRADVPLQPAGPRRASGWSRRARSATSTSSPRAASTSGPTGATSAWCGTSAPHDFSILLYWFGETPRRVRATGRAALSSGIADVAFITMTFRSGIVANVELSWLAPSKLRRTVLVGSEKMVVYDDCAARADPSLRPRHRARAPGELRASTSSPTARATSSRPQLETCEPLVAELADFVPRDPAAATACAGEMQLAREVVRMTEAAERSLNGGGQEIQLAPAAECVARRRTRSPRHEREPSPRRARPR